MKKILYIILFLAAVFVLFQKAISKTPIDTQNDKTTQDASSYSQPILKDHTFGQHTKLSSKVMKEEKNIFIYLPESYEQSTILYPVCYILDGKSYFEPFAGIVKYLSLFEMIPEMIVVAIESGDRLKEFTYTKANEKTGDWPTSGGADFFRKFLSDELIPYIDSSYRTHLFRIIIGHSLAGLFAVETLSRYPYLFQATIALSPSLYWNQYEWLKNTEILLKKHKFLKHFLLISGETKEEEQTELIEKLLELALQKAPREFYFDYKCFPDENHSSVALPALFYDLKKLFQGWQFPGEAWETGPDKVKTHFQSLSERYGFPVPITEEFVNAHAFHGLGRHNAPDEAIKLFEYCLTLYPNSDIAYEGLGEAYEQKEMKEKARKFYQKALELNPNNENALKQLKHLSSKK